MIEEKNKQLDENIELKKANLILEMSKNKDEVSLAEYLSIPIKRFPIQRPENIIDSIYKFSNVSKSKLFIFALIFVGVFLLLGFLTLKMM